MTRPRVSVIIPANNEQDYILRCLEALAAQEGSFGLHVTVAANACTDDTVSIAQGTLPRFEGKGWSLDVLDMPEGGKPRALNTAETAARAHGAFDVHAFLDADVILSPQVLMQTAGALSGDAPRYATGRLHVSRPDSWVTRRYAGLWCRLPFMAQGSAPGAGYFAVNAAGRACWDAFPGIISDDTYIRLLFAPEARVEVEASYEWPMVEGARNLIHVRRRQDKGVKEIAQHYPALLENDSKPTLSPMDHLRLILERPLDYTVYAGISLAVRFSADRSMVWSRGR